MVLKDLKVETHHLKMHTYSFAFSSQCYIQTLNARFLLNVPEAEEINSQGTKGQEKTFCVFLRSSSNCNFVDFGKLPFSPFSFCHHFCFIRKQEPICFLYEKKMFFSCIYMQANNSKQHVNLRQYINDFKKVFRNGIYSSDFRPLLLLHWGRGVS